MEFASRRIRAPFEVVTRTQERLGLMMFGLGARPEGLVARPTDSKRIAKIRSEGYERHAKRLAEQKNS